MMALWKSPSFSDQWRHASTERHRGWQDVSAADLHIPQVHCAGGEWPVCWWHAEGPPERWRLSTIFLRLLLKTFGLSETLCGSTFVFTAFLLQMYNVCVTKETVKHNTKCPRHEVVFNNDYYFNDHSFGVVLTHCCFFRLPVSEEDHSDMACFVCVLLSHGDNGTLSGTDRQVPLRSLTSLLTAKRCPSLEGKPKLFFIQVQNGSFRFYRKHTTISNWQGIVGPVKRSHCELDHPRITYVGTRKGFFM